MVIFYRDIRTTSDKLNISGVIGNSIGKIDMANKTLDDVAKMRLLIEKMNKSNGTVFGGAITR